MPFAVFTAIARPIGAKLAERFGTKVGRRRPACSDGVGFALAPRLAVDIGLLADRRAQMFFMGGGLGLVTAPATEAIMGSLPPDKAGVGSAVNDTTRELGGTLGVAIIGSLFASVYSTRLGELLTGTPVPAAAQRIAGESVGAGMEVARQPARRPAHKPALRSRRPSTRRSSTGSASVRGCQRGSCSSERSSPSGSCPAMPWPPRASRVLIVELEVAPAR